MDNRALIHRTRAPAPAFGKIVEWLNQATRFAVTGLDTDAPNDVLLLEALEQWQIGFAARPEIIRESGRNFIRVTLEKPNKEGQTTRDLDASCLAFALLLCTPGGRLRVEAKGRHGTYYYARLYIIGRRSDGQRRRVYLLRVAAGTPADRKTKEPGNFRSALRRDLGTYQQDPDNEPTRALYGVEDAKQDSVDRWREIEREQPAALPAPISADGFSILLNLAHYLHDRVPLGTAHAT